MSDGTGHCQAHVSLGTRLDIYTTTNTPFTRALVSGPARAGSVFMVRVNVGRAVPAQLGISSRASSYQPGLARVKYIV